MLTLVTSNAKKWGWCPNSTHFMKVISRVGMLAGFQAERISPSLAISSVCFLKICFSVSVATSCSGSFLRVLFMKKNVTYILPNQFFKLFLVVYRQVFWISTILYQKSRTSRVNISSTVELISSTVSRIFYFRWSWEVQYQQELWVALERFWFW